MNTCAAIFLQVCVKINTRAYMFLIKLEKNIDVVNVSACVVVLEARLGKMRDRDWMKILLVAFGGNKIIGRLRHDMV